jgi:Ca-activated chloride channel family protein
MDETIGQSTMQSFGEAVSTIINTPFSVIFDEISHMLNALHFIRADWFYAFIPLIIYLYLYSNKTLNNKNWQSVIDPKLLPFVLTKGSNDKRRRYPLVLTFIAVSLCITALAGPVYKKLPQPVYREQSSLVVLLDLSASMNATDIKPSRLSRAKLKLLDILKARKTGQTALIAYAADAFVVTPLTDDNATIANLVPALETEMMPAQGSNLSIALAKTFSLFNQAGIIKGDILVITDGIHERDEPAIEKVSSQGHRLSILGIGTTTGGPIPLLDSVSGGFLLDKNGAIVIPKLRPEKLQRYALAGSGIYTELKAGDVDVNRLTRLFQSDEIAAANKQGEDSEAESDTRNDNWADSWQEEGHWLLLPLLLLASLWARKGWIAAILPFTLIFFTAVPQPAYAVSEDEKPLSDVADITDATTTGNTSQPLIDTKNLWSSPDQKAMKAFGTGDIKKAAEQFTDPDWKASALYRDGDYQGAADALKNTNTSDGFYNRANALAQLGKYPEAIKAYDRALELDPQNDDAKHNREQVKQALKKQQQENADQNSDQNSDDQNQEKQDQDSQDQEQQEQNNEDQSNSQESDSQQSDAQDGDSNEQDADQQENNQTENDQPEDDPQQPASDSEQKQAEEQELKQRDAEAEQKKQEEEKQQYDQQQKEDQQQQEQQQKDEQKSDSVENKDSENDEAEQDPLEIEVNPTEASITEEEKATDQWLKRIPDDPGGLLRRKFLYQYKRAPNQPDSEEPW